MKTISFVYPNKFRIVTGGHRYEAELIDSLKKRDDFQTNTIYQHSGRLTGLRKLLSPFTNIFLSLKLRNSDLIVFNSTKGFYYLPLSFILSKVLGRKTLIIHHHFLHEEFSGMRRWRYKMMEKFFLKSANYVLTPSPYISDQLSERLGITPLLCHIPFDSVPATSGDANRKVHPGKMLYAGTIEPRKGLIYLIEALKKMGDVKYTLHIAGKVVDEKYYDRLINEININRLRVAFHGFLTKKELAELYATSDIFVFPSLLEGFGMSVNEAMKYGLPVVAFDNSAMPYSVNESNGILVKDRDAEIMGSKLAELISNRELREKLSSGASAHADTLPSHEEFRENSIAIFNSILN